MSSRAERSSAVRVIEASIVARAASAVALAVTVVLGVAAARIQVPPPPEGAPTTPALQRMLATRDVTAVLDGFGYADAPLWHPEGFLLFADVPRNRVHRWRAGERSASVIRDPSFGTVALRLDRENRLLAAEQQNRRISRTESDGSIVTVADRFEGRRLNGPHDLAVAADGAIFFTDPPYGLPQGEQRELDFQGVFRVDGEGQVRLVVRDMARPNGIALSPDGRTLYVADSERAHLRAFTLQPDGSADSGRVLADLRPWKSGVQGVPDGVAVSEQGHIFVAGPGGVWVFAQNGGRLGVIATPEPPAACAFGDKDRKTLYIAARTRVYSVRMTVAGAA